MNLEFVYKILDEKEWKEAKKNGVYSGTSKDIEDGYICLLYTSDAADE